MAMRLEKAEIEEYWRKTGERRGGEVGCRSFGRYIGKSGEGEARDLTGLLYAAADCLWFETISSPKTIMGIPLSLGRGVEEEPFEARFPLSDIEAASLVSLRDAVACVRGKLDASRLRPLSFLGNFFDSPALQLKLRDGASAFLESSRGKEIVRLVNQGEAGQGLPAE